MLAVSSTEARRDFGSVIDTIVRFKPVVIKRSRDYFMGISIEDMRCLVKDVTFTVEMLTEEDGSITLSLVDFDTVVNGKTKEEATELLIADLREYVQEYFEEPEVWSQDKHRRSQMKELIKVLVTESNSDLKECFKWQHGEI